MVPVDLHSIYFPAMEINGDKQLFGFSKYLCVQVWNDMRVSEGRLFSFLGEPFF